MKVEAVVNYLGEMAARPRYYTQDHGRENLVHDPRKVTIADVRGGAPSVAHEGFALVEHRSAAGDLRSDEGQRIYAREIEELVREKTDADLVVVGGKALLRFAERLPRAGTLFNSLPARFIHIDVSDSTARAFAARVAPRPPRRFVHYNIWRVLSRPPQDVPLALCDARSVEPQDLVPADAVFDAPDVQEWSFEGLLLRYGPRHRWFYFRDMAPGEAVIFRNNDSDAREPHHVVHTAFDDPSCPEDATPRASVEARAIALWF